MSDPTQVDGVPEPAPLAGVQEEPAAPIANIADGSPRKLDRNVVTTWRIGSAIAAGIFSFLALIGMLISMLAGSLPWDFLRVLLPLAWLLFVGALAAWAVLWPPVRYRHTSYRVFASGIEIRRGVIWRAVIHVPKTRVQHTDVTIGVIERAFGLATLVVYTAGTEHSAVSLGGLDERSAFAIRDHLIPGGGEDAV